MEMDQALVSTSLEARALGAHAMWRMRPGPRIGHRGFAALGRVVSFFDMGGRGRGPQEH